MSYQLVYGRDLQKKYPSHEKLRKKRFYRTVATILAIMCLIACHYWITHWLLSDNHAITTAAFDNMVDTIRNGARIEEAVVAFCEQILSDGR